MNLFRSKTTTPIARNSIDRSPLRLGFLLIPLVLACFGLSPIAQAANETTSNANTAEGNGALQSITTGTNNTALGAGALFSDTAGNYNTATGSQALKNNTANDNTADGFQALVRNTTGGDNTATGWRALFQNTTGSFNTANGAEALERNTTGESNTATGEDALALNTTGFENTANGVSALASNTTGGANTAYGFAALDFNTTGSNNIALGFSAGFNLTTGNYNIDIGNEGVAGESGTVRIGDSQTATYIAGISGTTIPSGVGVVVDTNGQLGIAATSSQRFKDAIKPMDKASEAILALKPVTFRYKKEIDADGTPQFGLVAEEVEKVNPALVTRDAKGQVYTVRYEAVNAMLLNEFLKAHRKMQEQEATIAELRSTAARQEATIAQQQKNFQFIAAQQGKEIKALTASLKEQASQIQKVSDQLEVSKPAPRTVSNNQ